MRRLPPYDYTPTTRREYNLPEEYTVAAGVVLNVEHFRVDEPYRESDPVPNSKTTAAGITGRASAPGGSWRPSMSTTSRPRSCRIQQSVAISPTSSLRPSNAIGRLWATE